MKGGVPFEALFCERRLQQQEKEGKKEEEEHDWLIQQVDLSQSKLLLLKTHKTQEPKTGPYNIRWDEVIRNCACSQ